MEKLRKNQGITLVALVVTIIILLILAGITISQLTGSGLFEKAKLAKGIYENSQKIEQELFGQYENAINGRYDDIIKLIVGTRDIDEEELRSLIEDAVEEKVNEKMANYATTNSLSAYATTSSLSEYAKTSDLSAYATKTELNSKNTTWTELGSTNSTTLQTVTVSNWDQYSYIVLEYCDNGNEGGVGMTTIMPTSEFKTTTSNKLLWCGFENDYYKDSSHTNENNSVWVCAYYDSGLLKYGVVCNQRWKH